MSEVYPLDSVIKKINSKYKTTDHDEQIVIIDTNTGRSRKKSLFFARDIEYYLIHNTKVPRNYAEHSFDYSISRFEDELDIGFRIKYRVSCQPGKEVKVAESLYDNVHPAAELERIIKKYIDEYLIYNFDVDIINNYYQVITSLNKNIISKVFKEIGLNIKLEINLHGENDLQNLIINSSNFPVQFKDYPERLDMKFQIEISIDENKKALAILHSSQLHKLEKIIQQEIKKYLLEKVLLKEFYGNLGTNIRHQLTNYLDKVLEEFGRKVDYLSLTSDDAISAKDFFEASHEVHCTAKGEKVIIKNQIQMGLEDIGQYLLAKSPYLERWIEKNLNRVIKSILFDKEYIEILLRFDKEIEQTIKNEIVNCAKDIGYSIKHFVSVPDLEPLKLQEQFSIEFEETFNTKRNRVKVKLNVVVNAKIEDLENIKDLINSRVDVKTEMQEVIKQDLSSFLHTVEPERFYMRFISTDPGHPEETLSLEEEIKNRIKDKLENKPFCANVISVTPKDVETDITDRVEKLQERFCQFEFIVYPLKPGESVCIRGAIQVERVHDDYWEIFQSRKYDLEEIKNAFIENITPKLATKNFKVLQYTEQKDLDGLEKLLNKWGNDFINEQFGLVVRIINVSRKSTSWDDAKNQDYKNFVLHTQKRLDTLVSAKEQLEDRIITLGSKPHNSKEIEHIEKKIKDIDHTIDEINKEISNYSLKTQEVSSSSSQLEHSRESSFSEIAKNTV